MSKTGQKRRAQQRATRRALPPLRTTTEPRIKLLIVNYHHDHLGWTAELLDPEHLDQHGGPIVLRWVGAYPTPHEVFDAAMRAVTDVADTEDAAVSTIHALDGDPSAWMKIAQRDGFAHLAH